MSKSPIHPVEARATASFARPRSERNSWAARPGGSVRVGATAQARKTLTHQGLMLRQPLRHLAHRRCRLAQEGADAVAPADLARPHAVEGAVRVRLEPAVRDVVGPGDGAGDARRDAAAGGVQVGEVLFDVRVEVLLDEGDARHPQTRREGRIADGGEVKIDIATENTDSWSGRGVRSRRRPAFWRMRLPTRSRIRQNAGADRMLTPSFTPEEVQDIRDVAARWGKIVARRAFGDAGPGLDPDLVRRRRSSRCERRRRARTAG